MIVFTDTTTTEPAPTPTTTTTPSVPGPPTLNSGRAHRRRRQPQLAESRRTAGRRSRATGSTVALRTARRSRLRQPFSATATRHLHRARHELSVTAGGPPPPAPGLFEAYEAIRVGSWPEAVAVGDVTGGRDRTSPATGARTSLSRAGRGRRGGLPAVGRRHARLRGRDADRQQQQGPDRPVERGRVPRRRRGRVGNEHRQRPPQRRERPPSRPGHPRGATRWVRRPRDRRRTRRSRRDVGPALRRPEHQRPRAAARAVGSARRPSTASARTSSRTGSVSATSPETGGATSLRATAATGRPHRSRSSPRRRPEHSTYRGATRATTSRRRSTWRENRGVRSRIDVFWYLKINRMRQCKT